MKRRSFFGFMGAMPVAAAASMILNTPEKQEAFARANEIRIANLGDISFPNAIRMPIDCELSEVSVEDAISYLPKNWDGEAEIMFGRYNILRAKDVRERFAPDVRLSLTLNTHPSWTSYRWALRWALRWRDIVVCSPGTL